MRPIVPRPVAEVIGEGGARILAQWLAERSESPRYTEVEQLGRAVLAAWLGDLVGLARWLSTGPGVVLSEEEVFEAAFSLNQRIFVACRPWWLGEPVILRQIMGSDDGVVQTLTGALLARPKVGDTPEKPVDFVALMKGLKEVIYSADPDGTLRFVSAGVMEMTGLSAEALVASPRLVRKILVSEDPATIQTVRQSLLVDHEPCETAHQFRNAVNGELRHVLHRLVPVVVGGVVQRIDGVLVDITERRELERRLGRTEHLRSLGALAGGIAHDFNNLLLSILGYSDLLLAQTREGSANANGLQMIVNAAERGAALTQRLLSFARGSRSNAKTPVHLGRPIRETVALVGPSVSGRVSVRMDEAHDVPLVVADSTQLCDAVLNLALNGAQACAEADGGEVVVTVRRATPDEGRRVGASEGCTILVDDNGPGMSEDVRLRVFEPLFTTRAERGGSGLGCAMAYGVAIEHGGTLEVDSKLGAGTTFRMLLPAAPEGTRAARGKEPRHPRPTKRSAQRLHILVADDEETVRALLCQILRGANYRVTAVESAEEAVSVVRERPRAFALAILDVMMPPGDGTMAFLRIREVAPTLPIVFCTGQTHPRGTFMPEALNLAPVISKPFRPSELLAIVGDVVSDEEDEPDRDDDELAPGSRAEPAS